MTVFSDIKIAAESLSFAEQQELLNFLAAKSSRRPQVAQAPYLCRYRALSDNHGREDVERNVLHQQIWFSSPQWFNDPYDCKVPDSRDVSDATLREWLERRYKNMLMSETDRKLKELTKSISPAELSKTEAEELLNYHKILLQGPPRSKVNALVNDVFLRRQQKQVIDDDAGVLQKYLDNSGVLSLSEVDDDLLMWSHYADGHKGVCLRYWRDALRFPDSPLQEVRYREQCPNAWLGSPATEWYGAWALSKSRHWCYEREWRVIRQPRAPGWEDTRDTLTETLFGWHKLPARALAGVILGCKIDPQDKRQVQEWCRLARHQVPIFCMKRKPDRYELELEAV